MKLIDIIKEISNITSLPMEYLMGNIDFWGGNKHLSLPLSDNYYTDTRRFDNPLTGDEIVHGEFLLYSYCGHDGVSVLKSYDTLTGLEDAILSPGGITNTFSTFYIPFIGGVPKEYRIKLTDENGNELYFVKNKNSNLFLESKDKMIEWV